MTAFPTAITSSNAAPLLGFGGTPGVLDRSGVGGGGGGAGVSWETLARRLQAGNASERVPGAPSMDTGLTATVPGLRGSAPTALSIKPGDEITPEQARKAAEEFVSMSLVQPVLAELRKMNKAYGAFAPGAHEKQFGPLMDAEIAMRMTKAQNFPLVDAVARNLLEYSQRQAPSAADSKPGGVNDSVEIKAMT